MTGLVSENAGQRDADIIATDRKPGAIRAAAIFKRARSSDCRRWPSERLFRDPQS
jgi:hypothetical protein